MPPGRFVIPHAVSGPALPAPGPGSARGTVDPDTACGMTGLVLFPSSRHPVIPSSRHPPSRVSVLPELPPVQPRVHAVERQQLVVRALLDDAAVVEDYHLVGAKDGAQAVG